VILIETPSSASTNTATTHDIMSGGRALLGIGAGEAMNLDPYGILWDSARVNLKSM